MRIEKIFGMTVDKIHQKSFNPFLGISIENKYFNEYALTAYIKWALTVSKEAVLVLIADEIQAINYRVLRKMKEAEAVQLAEERGLFFQHLTEKISYSINQNQTKIYIRRWKDMKGTRYQKSMTILQKFWNEDQTFRRHIKQCVESNLGSRSEDLSSAQVEELAAYLIDELALVLGGLVINDSVFDLNIYPGLGTSQLFRDLQEGRLFPKLTKELNIQNPIYLVEAYVE